MLHRKAVTRWMAAVGFSAALLSPLPSSAAVFEMKAGVAKAVITNTEPRIMVNGRVSRGVLSDIHARALALMEGDV